MYIRPGMKVADVTYGKGVFWRKADLSGVTLLKSDKHASGGDVVAADFTALPYDGGMFDVVVFDPPYMHGAGTINTQIADRYNNNKHYVGHCHKGIYNLYNDGLQECIRVVKVGGMILVKCQDEIASGKQNLTHIEVWSMALQYGLTVYDLFVLVSSATPMMRHKTQLHARKNHSYLWVFKKK